MSDKLTAMKPLQGVIFGMFYIILSVAGSTARAAEGSGDSSPKQIVPMPAASAKEDHVKSTASQEVGKRRMSLKKEAIVANDEMLHAMLLIEKKNSKSADRMLSKADTQLKALLTRDPQLKLAAIDVRASVNDLEVSADTIKKAVNESKSDLDKGQVQAAREVLSPLVSEMHIDTDFLPLDIYPAAIDNARKEIHEAKLKQAEAALADAMSSIVTIEDIIPLPPVKAEGDVLEAERLQKQDMAKNKDKVLLLLKSANDHLADADALGYGKYKGIRDEIATIKSSVQSGTAKPNAFDRIKRLFLEFIHDHKKA